MLPKSVPQYISAADSISNGSLQITKGDLVNNNIDIQKHNQYIQVYFPSNIRYTSDSFAMRFRVKVTPLNNTLCPYLWVEMFCQKNFLYFTSTLKGCTSELTAQFGKNVLNGKTNDFSSLGADVTAWQNVELTVKNKHVSIRLNGADAYSTGYSQSCGLITGLGFISNGLCQVDFVDLKTLDGKTIYSNDFNR